MRKVWLAYIQPGPNLTMLANLLLLCIFVLRKFATTVQYTSWARNNCLASRQPQRDNVTEPQGPVRDQKKFEK